jgi:hypothetical protein
MAILGYPRMMPPKYEKWLPKFSGTDAISVEEHMNNFWAFFQLHPVIAQFVARIKGLRFEGQTGIIGTNPTQCHHNGMVLSI